MYLEEPVRVASTTRINLEEPIRVASPHRINLEEPVRVASTTRINLPGGTWSGWPAHIGLTWRNPVRVASPHRIMSFLRQSVCESVSLCVRDKRGDRVKEC